MTARRGNCHFNSRIDVRFGKGLNSSLFISAGERRPGVNCRAQRRERESSLPSCRLALKGSMCEFLIGHRGAKM